MQLSDFKTYVKYDWKRTDKDTELVQFYNDMIVWIASKMPNPGYKFQSYLEVTANQEDIPLPSTIQHIIHPLRYLQGSDSSDSGWALEHLSKKEYDVFEPNPNRTSPTTGAPSKYTIYSNSILLTPIPGTAESGGLIEINWAKQITDMSDDSDTPSLSNDWEEVLKQGTLERLFACIGMYPESEFWGSKYHLIDGAGNDVPVGLCKQLLEIEEEREEVQLGQVKFNGL